MIDLLDEALRDFLVRELPVRDNEIDISFEQPKREWAARLSKPTLNLFLREVRENPKLRAPHPVTNAAISGDVAVLSRQAVRMDLHYMATAWARDPLDEHRILSRLLSTLFRLRAVPDDIIAEHVPGQEAGVPLKLAQGEPVSSASDIWSVLDNEMRPAIDVVATLAIYPHVDVVVPLVREVDIRYVQMVPLGPPPAAGRSGANGPGKSPPRPAGGPSAGSGAPGDAAQPEPEPPSEPPAADKSSDAQSGAKSGGKKKGKTSR